MAHLNRFSPSRQVWIVYEPVTNLEPMDIEFNDHKLKIKAVYESKDMALRNTNPNDKMEGPFLFYPNNNLPDFKAPIPRDEEVYFIPRPIPASRPEFGIFPQPFDGIPNVNPPNIPFNYPPNNPFSNPPNNSFSNPPNNPFSNPPDFR